MNERSYVKLLNDNELVQKRLWRTQLKHKFHECSSPEVAKVLERLLQQHQKKWIVSYSAAKIPIFIFSTKIYMSWKVRLHIFCCNDEDVKNKRNTWKSGDTTEILHSHFWIKCFLNGNFYISLNTTLLYKWVWLIILIQGFKALWISISQLRKRLEKFLVVDFFICCFCTNCF